MAGNENPLWHVAKDAGVYSHYLHKDYENEGKYLASLSNEEKKWLGNFWNGYYKRAKKAFEALNFTVKQRRESYNRHRGVVADVFHRATRLPLADNLLIKKAFA